MSLNARFFLPILAVALVGVLGAGWLGWRAIDIGAERDRGSADALETLARAADVQADLEAAEAALSSVLDMTRLVDTSEAWATFSAASERIAGHIEWLAAHAGSTALGDLVASLDTHRAAWTADASILLGATPAAQVPTLEKVRRNGAAVSALAHDIAVQARADAASAAQASARDLRRGMLVAGAVCSALVLVAIAGSLVLARRLSGQVAGIAADLRRMAGVGQEQAEARADELEEMRRAVEILQRSLDERDALAARALEEEKERAARIEAEQKRAEEDRKRAEEERRAEQQRAAAKAAQAEAFASFETELSAAVTAAVAGDFSARVGARFSDAALVALAERMNALLAGTDNAISEVSRVLTAFAAGDLTTRMEGQFGGVLAELQRNANMTAEKLEGMVTDIQSASDDIRSSIATIAGGAQQLSQRTSGQAVSLEATSTAMEQISAAVNATADNAEQARSLSKATANEAADSAAVAEKAVAAIKRVEEQSKKISEITALVDGIAFQTNLLALNASVEAARAGEAGKGFAVVAAEVRGLAQRAADSASEIKALIDASVVQVAESSRLVADTGASLSSIRNRVTEVVSAVDEISRACRDQSEGVGSVTQTIGALDAGTRDNAVLARESVAAAESVSDQADRLAVLAEFFAVRDSATAQRTSWRAVA